MIHRILVVGTLLTLAACSDPAEAGGCAGGITSECSVGGVTVCVDLRSDVEHCGACGHACGAGYACVAAECRGYTATCGDGKVTGGEEWDPLPGPFTTAPVTPLCRFDFSSVPQLYCHADCSWGGAPGCDQADADVFCKLRTDNPRSTASAFTAGVRLDAPGFSCPGEVTLGTDIGPLPSRGVTSNVFYSDGSIAQTHGPSGIAIVAVTCTDP
jgi:hypothetical protein